MKKTLAELVNKGEPAITLIRQWVESAENQCEILPPSDNREAVLLEVQVTTHSTLGGIAYETGGILVDHGWLRFFGSGHPNLAHTLSAWNQGRSDKMFLVADDAAGGFFAINGGAFGEDFQNLYYWAPDRLDWEPLGIGFTGFFCWSLSSRLAEFYKELRWATWMGDVPNLSGDHCFSFYPFLWTQEGSVDGSDRRPIPATEAFDLKMDIVRQLRR